MGNTWEVTVWQYLDFINEYAESSYWRGESFIKALWYMREAKKETKSGRIRLIWRPSDE